MSEIDWDRWKNYLLQEYNLRNMKIASMGGQITKKQKGFSVIFLSAERLDMPPADVPGEIIKIIKGGGASISEGKNQNISMLGHRFGIFGMIESIDDICKYFMEAHLLLNPKGQILLTSINTHNTQNLCPSRKGENSLDNREMKFQYGNLFGPYFGLFFIDSAFMQDQIKKTNWRLKLIHEQGEEGCSVLLT